VPVLWDRPTSTILSSSPVGIGIDLATAFRTGVGAIDLLPAAHLAAIEQMSQRVASEIESQVGCAVYKSTAATKLRAALARFDSLLGEHSHLVAARLTDADIRLWVQLVRYDAGPNAHHAIGPRLDTFPNLWRWAQQLYALDAFASTTDLDRFAAPKADLPPWG
jgi:putative glutathione S-transferase